MRFEVENDFGSFRPASDDLSRINAEESWWYSRGSGLYNCVRILEEHADLKAFETMYVGEVDGRDFSERAVLHEQKTRVIDMLLGMAIEAWLKGLMVASGPKDSEDLQKEVHRLTDRRLIEMGKTAEVTFEDIFEAMDSPQIEAVLARLSDNRRTEAKERVALIRDHHQHDLCRMASAIGFNPPLGDPEKWALRYYSQMIELGRYPATNKPRDLVQIKNRDALNAARDELFGHIHRMRDFLRVSPR